MHGGWRYVRPMAATRVHVVAVRSRERESVVGGDEGRVLEPRQVVERPRTDDERGRGDRDGCEAEVLAPADEPRGERGRYREQRDEENQLGPRQPGETAQRTTSDGRRDTGAIAQRSTRTGARATTVTPVTVSDITSPSFTHRFG